MKKIKRFESLHHEYDNIDEDIQECKYILTDFSDEYSDIEVTVSKYYRYESLKVKNPGIRISINTYNALFNKDQSYTSVSHIKKKIDFINKLLVILERIEKSLNKKCDVLNVWKLGAGTESIDINVEN